jgi:hypothetical protein
MGSPFDGLMNGEVIGDIEQIFYTNKHGERIVQNATIQNQTNKSRNNADIPQNQNKKTINDKNVNKTTNNLKTNNTIIVISKEVLGTDEDAKFELSENEEQRFSTFSPRNREFVDIETGDFVTIIEKTEMYNGTFLYTIKKEDGKLITYPRSMFIGRTKKFVPKEYYIRESMRTLEDTMDNNYMNLLKELKNDDNFVETEDGDYIELVLDVPLEINGSFKIPDKMPIDILRMYDLEYKILLLKKVICLNNRIASLIFEDLWF